MWMPPIFVELEFCQGQFNRFREWAWVLSGIKLTMSRGFFCTYFLLLPRWTPVEFTDWFHTVSSILCLPDRNQECILLYHDVIYIFAFTSFFFMSFVCCVHRGTGLVCRPAFQPKSKWNSLPSLRRCWSWVMCNFPQWGEESWNGACFLFFGVLIQNHEKVVQALSNKLATSKNFLCLDLAWAACGIVTVRAC